MREPLVLVIAAAWCVVSWRDWGIPKTSHSTSSRCTTALSATLPREQILTWRLLDSTREAASVTIGRRSCVPKRSYAAGRSACRSRQSDFADNTPAAFVPNSTEMPSLPEKITS